MLDLRGVVCPGPIVEAKKLLNGMRAGETLKLVSNCPGIGDDVADWVKATGYRLLATEEIGPGEFEFYIGKPDVDARRGVADALIKSHWFKSHGSRRRRRAPTEIAGAAAFIVWRIAQNSLKTCATRASSCRRAARTSRSSPSSSSS